MLTDFDDEHFMALSLKLASRGIGLVDPNPAVGCMIVKNNKILGQGWHQKAGGAHAEIHALNQAGELSKGACMYVTLEPCCHSGKTAPCSKAIIQAGIGRIVIACEDPNPLVCGHGIAELRRAGMAVVLHVGEVRARSINRGFFHRMQTAMPWVTLKIAASLDGKTAMASGMSQWITSQQARQDGHKLRAECSAIVTGVGTVISDNPKLTARQQRQPPSASRPIRPTIRVIIDSNLRTPQSAQILDGEGEVIIFTSNAENFNQAVAGKKFADKKGVEMILCPQKLAKVDLHFVMMTLAKREINSVLVEAGEKLSGSFLRANLVNELVVYMAPDCLGSDGKNMFRIAGLDTLEQKIRFKFKQCIRIGRDLKLVLTPYIDSDE